MGDVRLTYKLASSYRDRYRRYEELFTIWGQDDDRDYCSSAKAMDESLMVATAGNVRSLERAVKNGRRATWDELLAAMEHSTLLTPHNEPAVTSTNSIAHDR